MPEEVKAEVEKPLTEAELKKKAEMDAINAAIKAKQAANPDASQPKPAFKSGAAGRKAGAHKVHRAAKKDAETTEEVDAINAAIAAKKSVPVVRQVTRNLRSASRRSVNVVASPFTSLARSMSRRSKGGASSSGSLFGSSDGGGGVSRSMSRRVMSGAGSFSRSFSRRFRASPKKKEYTDDGKVKVRGPADWHAEDSHRDDDEEEAKWRPSHGHGAESEAAEAEAAGVHHGELREQTDEEKKAAADSMMRKSGKAKHASFALDSNMEA